MIKIQFPRLIHLFAILALTLLPASGAAAWSKAPGASEVIIQPGDPIQIAIAMMMDFPAAQDIVDAVQLAMDDYGPIKGFDLISQTYDAGCDQTAGDAAGAAIVADPQNVGVIGPFCSNSTMGAAPHFESAGVVMISHSNTMQNLYPHGPNIFNRMVVTDPDFEGWMLEIERLPSVANWQTRFENTFGRAPFEYAKTAYDAATLLLKRIDQVSRIDSAANLVIDRSALATAVRNTFEFSGVTGKITLDAFGDRVNVYKEYVWHDPFTKSTLDSGWSWVNEDPSHWSLTARPGFMRIVTQDPYPNRLIRTMPSKDFQIRTRLLFEPTQNFQFAGLLIFLDEGNLLALGRAFCDTPPPDCVGNGIYFDHIEGGNFVPPNFATWIPEQDEVYLQLARQGNNYTAYASENGTEWIGIGTHSLGFTPRWVGLEANNQAFGADEINADFDFFLMEFTASQAFLPLAAHE